MQDQLSLEYIFFHAEPYQQFKQFLSDKQVSIIREAIDQTDVEAHIVYISDDLDDALQEEIEAYYEDMMALSESLVAAETGSEEMNQVGLAVTVKDGRSVLASIDPQVLNRILSVISSRELGQLVDNIVDAVENPDGRPLCKRD